MIRRTLSILAGYAIFVISSLMLFRLSGQNPHADPTSFFVMLAAVYGSFFSFLAGFTTSYIANTKTLAVNIILFIIIAGFATFSFLKTDGNHWTQFLAIFIFAPLSILGGVFCNKRHRAKR